MVDSCAMSVIRCFLVFYLRQVLRVVSDGVHFENALYDRFFSASWHGSPVCNDQPQGGSCHNI